MPLTAVCSADSSHVIKVDKWLARFPYTLISKEDAAKEGFDFQFYREVTNCICGAAIKVIEEEKCQEIK